MNLTQEQFDKLIAIASSTNLVLKVNNVKKVMVETCHGVNAMNIEIMTTDDIDNFLDSVFECSVE